MFDVISTGILVVDHLTAPIPRLPAAGELILCQTMPLAIGGCAANVTVDLARLGVRAGALGAVGDDPLGRYMIDSLAERGVDTSGIRRSRECETSCSLIINVAGEDRRFITTIGANAALTPEDIRHDLVRQAKVLYLGGYLFTPALENDRMVEVFRRARAAGVKTVLDVVVAGQTAADARLWERLAPLLSETDVFLPNDHEGRLITGLADCAAQAQRFHEAGARSVVITCGKDGAVLVSDRVRLRAGVYPIDYVGGTGSGDAFDAGYIMGLLTGGDERACLQWGAAVGASCVRAVSATESVFTREEAEQFMRRHKLTIEEF